MRYLLCQHNLRVLGITETWLVPAVHNATLPYCGYDIFRADRETRGGGVMILVDNKYESQLISSKTSHGIELLHIWIKRPFTAPVNVFCIYRPPDGPLADFLDTFHSNILPLSMHDQQIVVLGDVNIDMSKNSPPLKQFKRVLK